MKNMVNDFRDYARLPPPLPVALDLNALVGEVLELYEDGPVAVRAELDPALPLVLADPDQIRQVLHNLVKNAGEATVEKAGAEKSGAAAITVQTFCAGRMACLSVADCGTGFPPEILARAFEPYVTTKPKGTGLGLAIVKKIADDHGGEIRLANRPAAAGGGAEVSLLLPLHQPPQRTGIPA
jgi:nitrogen fixation/metabolism regulation signal transduction histidine kinase